MAEWVKTRMELPGRGFDRWFLDSGRPGYRIVIFGGVHGDETEGVIAAHRIAGAALGLKAGSVTVVPIVNEEAYRADTRLTPADGANLARVFPGRKEGTPTEQIVYALTSDVLVGCDLLIDLHTSGRTLDIPSRSATSMTAATGRDCRSARRRSSAPISYGVIPFDRPAAR